DLAGRRVRVYHGEALRLLGAGIVAAAADRATVMLAIVRQLHGDEAIRVIRIQESALPNPFAQSLGKGEAMRLVPANLLEQVQWTIRDQASSSAWLAQMDKKRRTDLTQRIGRAYRKLGSDAALHTFDTPESMREYCRLMQEVYARTWHHDDLPTQWDHPLRVALFERLATSGHIIGHVVIRDGKPLAYVHGYRVAGTYLVDDLGYDEDVAKVGIGSVAVFQAITALLDRFPGENVSFGYGDNQYKRLLATHNEPCGSLYVVRATRATAGFHVYAPVRWLYRGLHRVREDMRARKRV
ncbi:MAG: GNAT family N-acetyltransferase, partial [Luteibacter sp.]